jgi:uncharacterized Fe-S cluster-containing protein
MTEEITVLLPGYNCGECGYRQCADFAEALAGESGDRIELTACPHLESERFHANIPEIEKLLTQCGTPQSSEIRGVIDGLLADFTIAPLPGEPSCREDLYPFDRGIEVEALKGEHVRYRPWGCPVTHFAKVLDVRRGILTVHLVGPLHRLGSTEVSFIDIGICMVAGFDGIVEKGKIPKVGQTVRFVPVHCMMQKVHSGVIVHSEGARVRIEGIDLKVF